MERKINSFSDLFDEINYDYDGNHHVPHIFTNSGNTYITFNKLTFSSEGHFEYKGQYTDFDVALWPRLLAFVDLFRPLTTSEKVLYGTNEET